MRGIFHMGDPAEAGPRPGPAPKALGASLTDTNALRTLIEPVVTAKGFELVRLAMQGSKYSPTLQLMAEDPATGQLTLEQCASLSRAVSVVLDEADPIENEYRLEVSSPGIDRPLTRPKDWTDWAGHQVRVTLAAPMDGRKKFDGLVIGATEDSALVDVPGQGETALPFAAIEFAKLALTDQLIKATRPLSTEGADELEDDQEED